MRQRSGAGDETFNTRQFARKRVVVYGKGGFVQRFREFFLVLEVAVDIDDSFLRAQTLPETAEAGRDVLQTRGERRYRRSHPAVESDEEQTPLTAGECVQRGLEKVFGNIVVKRTLVVAHRVLVQPAAPMHERPIEKLLRLAAESSPENHRKAPLKLVLLAWNQRPVVVFTEHFAERRNVAQQRSRRLDVLHETPQFGQRVLHRCSREQQHRRRTEKTPDPVSHQRFVRIFVVDAVPPEPFVQPRKNLMRFVDNGDIERRDSRQATRNRARFPRIRGRPDKRRRRRSSSDCPRAWMANRFASSFCHCPIRDFGTINRTRWAPSARLCAITSPASIVFPSPTSSARMQPPSRSRRSAKMTASIW